MLSQLRQAIILFVFLAIITGIIYPFFTTWLGQTIFPYQTNGSLLERDNKIIGSKLIGQNFTSNQYFWGRLSATASFPYNAAASSGSNLGPSNTTLFDNTKARIKALHLADKSNIKPIPVDLVTTSASGLDPDISIAAAFYQAPRIANMRHLSLEVINQLILQFTQKPFLGFMGESRINVTPLNIALDDLKQ